MSAEVLVLYYSRRGGTVALATQVARGINAVEGMSARVRTVPPVSATTEATQSDIPDSGPPFVTPADLGECAGVLALETAVEVEVLATRDQLLQHGPAIRREGKILLETDRSSLRRRGARQGERQEEKGEEERAGAIAVHRGSWGSCSGEATVQGP